MSLLSRPEGLRSRSWPLRLTDATRRRTKDLQIATWHPAVPSSRSLRQVAPLIRGTSYVEIERWLKPVLPWRIVLAGVLLSRMCGEFLVLVLNLANSIAADSSVRWNEAVLSVGSAFSITGESLAQQYFLVAVDLSTIASLLFLASSLWRVNSAVGFSRYLYRTFGLWSCYLFVRVAIKWYVSP